MLPFLGHGDLRSEMCAAGRRGGDHSTSLRSLKKGTNRVRLNDLFDPERGPATLVKLALYQFIFVVACRMVVELMSRLSSVDVLLGFLFLILLSPLAYLIRKARGHGLQRGGGRRGAERTPALPPNEDME